MPSTSSTKLTRLSLAYSATALSSGSVTWDSYLEDSDSESDDSCFLAFFLPGYFFFYSLAAAYFFLSALEDAELLLLHCLGRDERSWLIAHDHDELPTGVVEAFSSMSKERLKGVPLAYLLGHREFWSLKLKVSRDVLIPRPETELLVEWALELASRYDLESMLDLGTGSGAIALAVQHDAPHLSVTASDVS